MPRKSQTKPPGNKVFPFPKETPTKKRKKSGEELLASFDLAVFFVEGDITINKRTCEGIACRLCIKACPTSALYWKAGEVAVTKDLCIYCGACVLSCIVDNCVKITRKRETGKIESFSNPRDFAGLQDRINAERRFRKVKEAFPASRDYVSYVRRKRKRDKKAPQKPASAKRLK